MAKAVVTTGIIPNGSLSEPGMSFVGDPASGIYRNADGSIVHVIGGSAVATVSSAGWSGVTLVSPSFSGATAINVQRISVGFAALNTAGDGVAALFGTAIPDNAIIIRTYFDVATSFSGDGDSASTLKVGLEDQDNDVKAAAALSTFAAGLVEGIQTGTMASSIKLSAARQLAVTWDIGGTDTALDAGAMDVFIHWVQGS
jgi:hypothetical protein